MENHFCCQRKLHDEPIYVDVVSAGLHTILQATSSHYVAFVAVFFIIV